MGKSFLLFMAAIIITGCAVTNASTGDIVNSVINEVIPGQERQEFNDVLEINWKLLTVYVNGNDVVANCSAAN